MDTLKSLFVELVDTPWCHCPLKAACYKIFPVTVETVLDRQRRVGQTPGVMG